MNSVFDIAEFILGELGEITTWKLQKLIYYCQAHHLAEKGKPLIKEDFEAWANGPVCRPLYEKHRNLFNISTIGGNAETLLDSEMRFIRLILKKYGAHNGDELSQMTHRDSPWKRARVGLRPGERGNHVIQYADLATAYS